jgi:hypothetical protein
MPIEYPASKKVAIVGMEIEVTLKAQYNPKELSFEKSANWSPADAAIPKQNGSDVNYKPSPPRTLSMELMFDGYEEDVDVSREYVSKLMQLINVMDPDGVDEDRKRPSMIQVVWPEESERFRGVLQSVSTKYTMFNENGKPVRATCSIKVMEVSLGALLKKAKSKAYEGW